MKLALVALGLAGCIETNSVQCSDGSLCPPRTTCHGITGGTVVCATPEQLAACDGKPDLTQCNTMPASSCHDGVCLPIVCGNALVDLGEACDDGNTITGDGCSGDCTSNETCGNGAVDSLKIVGMTKVLNETCDDHNLVSGDGCASTCAAEQLDWQELQPIAPAAQSHPALAYDPYRRRVIMFGGRSTQASHDVLDDSTFEWNGAGWARQATPAAPAGRQDARMVYDAARRQVLLYGGNVGDDSKALADFWAWNGDRWTVVQTATPKQRDHFGMVYDSARKVVVMFGGFVDQVWSNDTWEWDGSTWHLMSPPRAPDPRGEFVMAYDPKRGVVVLAGGFTDQPSTRYFNDTWEYDGTTWHQVSTSTPSGLALGAMAYDTIGHRMIAYGGYDGGSISAQTYAYDGTTWTPLGQAQPGVLYKQDMASDAVTGTIVMYGGETDLLGPATVSARTWIWNGAAWALAPAQSVPTTSAFAAAAYDPLRGREWMFGGQDATLTATSQLWSYDGSIWTKKTPAGGPSARVNATAAYDAARHDMVVFGGGTANNPVPNETWLWDGTSWMLATPTSSPPARLGAVMAYDFKRKKVVMFGGQGAGATPLSDTWEWDGDWHLIPIAAQPSSRIGAEASFDPMHGIVVRDGISPPLQTPLDTIAYDGTAWTTLDATNAVPARGFASFIYEPLRQRSLLIEGTRIGSSSFGDTWEWDGTTMAQQLIPNHPLGRGGAIAFPGPDGADVILYGGSTAFDGSGTRLFDTWRLRWGSAGPRENCESTVDDDGDGLAGCADPDCWTRCTPLCPPGSTCDPAEPACGDGTCNAALENCRNCPVDCTCSAVCGDMFCDASETHVTCPGDCP